MYLHNNFAGENLRKGTKSAKKLMRSGMIVCHTGTSLGFAILFLWSDQSLHNYVWCLQNINYFGSLFYIDDGQPLDWRKVSLSDLFFFVWSLSEPIRNLVSC